MTISFEGLYVTILAIKNYSKYFKINQMIVMATSNISRMNQLIAIYSEFHDSDTKTLYRYIEYNSYQDAINDGHTTQVLLNDCHRNTYYNLEDDTSERLISEAQRDSITGSNSKDIETEVSRLLSEKFGMDIKGDK